MKKIAIFTATRAEYHLLYNVIKRVSEDEGLELDLIVTGTHLLPEYGMTLNQIKDDGFKIDKTFDIIKKDSKGNVDINETIASCITECSSYFKDERPDMLIVLGDRYEILGPVIAASNLRIPISHIHGGETTEAAVDEAVRHAVTKFSYLHFAGCEEYRKRIIQLGENPERVFNAGTLGVENILNTELMSLGELSKSLDFNLKDFGLVTFHPVTLEKPELMEEETVELFEALVSTENLQFIITGSNADEGSERIRKIENDYINRFPERFVYSSSLGLVRYLTAMKYCKMVIGNSSSGILEAPTFKTPTINIGDRQRGRIQTESVINCKSDRNEIKKAIDKALSEDFLNSISDMKNIYGNGEASRIIVDEIKKSLSKDIDLSKSFYDIDFDI